jgi:hypothetical protein
MDAKYIEQTPPCELCTKGKGKRLPPCMVKFQLGAGSVGSALL